MAHPMALPTVAALVLAGSVLGAHLGRSVIAEIDPAHFGANAQSHFFADLVPGASRLPRPSPVNGEDFWAHDVGVPDTSACDRCGSFVEPAEFYSSADYPSVGLGAYAQAAALPEPVPDSPHVLMPEDIRRYAYFPVTREEAKLRQDRRELRPSSYADGTTTLSPGAMDREPPPIGM